MRLFVTSLCVAISVGVGVGVAAAQEGRCRVKPESITFDVLPNPGFTLPVRIGGALPHQLLIDTGSTGIVVGSMHVGNTPRPVALSKAELQKLKLQDYIVYSSSGNVMEGHWVYTSLELSDGKRSAMVDHIPVLAVEKLCTAKPGQLNGPFDCTNTPKLPVDCKTAKNNSPERSLCDVGMMGVGFDRGTSMGTSALNPFLNLRQMRDREMQRGYIISTTKGVTLGMTPADVAGFKFLPLSPDPQSPGEWFEAHGCVAITGGGIVDPGKPVCGDILMDTGVFKMFVSYAPRFLPAFNPPIPPVAGGELWNCPPRMKCTIHGNAPTPNVTVTWPGPLDPILTYSISPVPFTSTGKNPELVHLRATTSPLTNPGENVFVNTSRQLLYTADYLFDATCGRIGFRPKQPRTGR